MGTGRSHRPIERFDLADIGDQARAEPSLGVFGITLLSGAACGDGDGKPFRIARSMGEVPWSKCGVVGVGKGSGTVARRASRSKSLDRAIDGLVLL